MEKTEIVMDYEKKYNEALERAKELLDSPRTCFDIVQLKEIFPELRESEDERIIKTLQEYVKNRNWALNGPTQDEVLAWLEKQKESLHISETCKENADSFTDEDERIRRKMIEHFKSKAKETWCNMPVKDIISYLEKQKEQPTNEEMLRTLRVEYEKGVADTIAKYEQKEQRPAAEEILAKAGLKPYKDGNQWCILAGDNIQEGICGFGDTIDEALYEFLKEVLIMANSPQLKEQKPEEKPINWTELTWKDIDKLEGIINNVHYEFRNGIGQESFGKEVLEKFREYKGDEYLDEKEQKPLSTEETELNSLAFLSQMGYTCIPPKKEHQNNSDAPKNALGGALNSPLDKDKNLDDIAQDYVEGVKEYNPEPTWDLMQTAVCYGYHYRDQKEQKPITESKRLANEVIEYLTKCGYSPVLKDDSKKEHFHIDIPRHEDDFWQSEEYKHCRSVLGEYYMEGDYGGDTYTLYIWREKKEQRPVETSDFKTKLAEYLQNNSPKDGKYVISAESILEMAKEELIKRGELQKPAEWSEEDLQHKSWILECLADGEKKMPEYAEDFRAAYKWLKSLRPSWKPQQEQQEMDLEEEIEQCWQSWLSPSNQSSAEGVLPKSEFSMYARHFYELGKNSK